MDSRKVIQTTLYLGWAEPTKKLKTNFVTGGKSIQGQATYNTKFWYYFNTH